MSDDNLPNHSKRYSAGFSYQNNYYSPVVSSWVFDNGKLVNVDNLIPVDCDNFIENSSMDDDTDELPNE